MIKSKQILTERGNVRDFDLSPELSLLFAGRCPKVTCGQQVAMGEILASSECPTQGNLYAPAAGTISEADRWHLVLSVAENPDQRDEELEKYDLKNCDGAKLHAAFSQLGVSLPTVEQTELLIVNGARPEPGIICNEKYIIEYEEVLIKGLEAAERIYSPKSSVLAVSAGSPLKIAGYAVREIPMAYPHGLDPLVVKSITGKENPAGVVVLNISTLFELGTVLETGVPLSEVLVQAGDDFFKVRVGTSVGAILSEAGVAVHHLGRVVLENRMRGMAAHSLAQGVEKDSLALFFIDKTPDPIAEDTPCVGCGECVRRCPARIDPATISGCAEFGLYEKARDNHIDACIDCGLCSYFCIAHRPVLQYIRLAKRELSLIDASCEAQAGEGAA